VLSIHKTAVGAYKAMCQARSKRLHDDTYGALPYLGFFLCNESSGPKTTKGSKNDWWINIKKMEIEE